MDNQEVFELVQEKERKLYLGLFTKGQFILITSVILGVLLAASLVFGLFLYPLVLADPIDNTVEDMFFDIDDGDMIFGISDNMGMDSDGHMMMRMGDNMAMDMDSGEMHMVSGWGRDDDDDYGFKSSCNNNNGFGSSWDDDDDW